MNLSLKKKLAKVRVENGVLLQDEQFSKVAVIERHKATKISVLV